MANDVYIQSCMFVDFNKKNKEVGRSYGFRIFDDEGRDYYNNLNENHWNKLRQEGPDEILKFFVEFGYDGQAIAEFAMENKSSVYFDGEWTAISGYPEVEIVEKDEEEID